MSPSTLLAQTSTTAGSGGLSSTTTLVAIAALVLLGLGWLLVGGRGSD
ncbi:MAG: hypothetical protein ABEJ42_07735 [Halobacteriaceae archaeon]